MTEDGWQEALDTAIDLLDKARRLPVIRNCGECGHCDTTRERVSEYAEPEPLCVHPDWPLNGGVVVADAPPPDWCPLRGKP